MFQVVEIMVIILFGLIEIIILFNNLDYVPKHQIKDLSKLLDII